MYINGDYVDIKNFVHTYWEFKNSKHSRHAFLYKGYNGRTHVHCTK